MNEELAVLCGCPVDECGVQQLKQLDGKKLWSTTGAEQFVTRESVTAASSLGPEVLYMVDPVEEYGAQQLNELDGKKLKSTAKAEFELSTKLMKDVFADMVEKEV